MRVFTLLSSLGEFRTRNKREVSSRKNETKQPREEYGRRRKIKGEREGEKERERDRSERC